MRLVGRLGDREGIGREEREAEELDRMEVLYAWTTSPG